MAKKPPGESPEDKLARERERRIAALERDSATQRTAGDLTTDIRSVYGLRGIPLQFGSAAAPPAATVPAPGAGVPKHNAKPRDSWADRYMSGVRR